MGMGTAMKWIAKEGTGAGIQLRFLGLFLGGSRRRPTRKVGLLQQFMGSATAAVKRFGPAWARQGVWGRPVGVWLLVMCWIALPALVVLKVVF
jgi:hypothetical protein